jgi:hypothetical protein
MQRLSARTHYPRGFWGFDGGEKGFDHSEHNRLSGLNYLPEPSRVSLLLHQLLRLLFTTLGLHSNLVDCSSLHEPYQRVPPAFLGEDSVA